MKIRFQADADLNQNILLATVRRESSIDFRTAEAAGLAHLRDIDVLIMAAREGRMVVTHDQKTMPRQFAEFITTETSPGLVVVPQHLTIAAVTEDLLLIWFASEAEEWINRISFLPV
jgi:predicted nuclease of predicted toxin-antitoxin system